MNAQLGPYERRLYREGRVPVAASGWTRYPGKTLSFGDLCGTLRKSVAVVGAGLAGTSVALHLAEAGADVVLIDAREPGYGASGRNAGHVVTHREILNSFRHLPDRGDAFLDLWRREIDLTFDLARRHGIDCDAVQGGYLKVAPTRGSVAKAHRHAETYARLGLPVRFVDRDEAARFTGTDRFHGGVLDERGGRINPYHFTRGLAGAAQRAGAAVHANSPVTALQRIGSSWRLTVPNGSIEADQVILCTGAYDEGSLGGLTACWHPTVAYAIATKPLPAGLRSQILPTGGICAQLPRGLHPYLVDGLGRLITASIPGHRAEAYERILARLQAWLHRTYPQSAGVQLEVDAYWTGALAFSTDELPKIFDLGPGLLALTGFCSEGNVPAPILGKHLAEKLMTGRLEELAIPLQPARPVWWRNRYDFLISRVMVPLSLAAERVGITV